jgi:hypothetical protein
MAALDTRDWLFQDIHWRHPVSARTYNLFREMQESTRNWK